MRLWHVDLIPYLPKKQLLAQWRECVLISKNLAERGTPNHVLVNKILDYSSDEIEIYGNKIIREMTNRYYNVSFESYHKFLHNLGEWRRRRRHDLNGQLPKYASGTENASNKLFGHWHNDKYMIQCFENLREKYDCGAISNDEFEKVRQFVIEYFKDKSVVALLEEL